MSDEIGDDEIAAFLDEETRRETEKRERRAHIARLVDTSLVAGINGTTSNTTSQTEILWERVRATERRLTELESQMRWCVLCVTLLGIGLITALTALATR